MQRFALHSLHAVWLIATLCQPSLAQDRPVNSPESLRDFKKHCTSVELSSKAIIKNCSIFIDRGWLSGEHLAEAYNSRGIGYDEDGQTDLAISDYRRSIELNPNQSNAYHNMAVLYVGRGDLPLALKFFDEAIARGAVNVGVRTRRGLVLLRLTRYGEAFDAIIRDNPQHFGAHYLRGLAKKRSGDGAGGDADIAQARKLGEADRKVYDFVIRDFEAQGLKP